MVAVREPLVRGRRGAGSEAGAVEGALEGGFGAIGRELEGRVGARGRVGRLARDRRLERHRQGDVPRVLGRGLVDQAVGRGHDLERMRPRSEARVRTGEVQGCGDSPSREQWNVARATSAEKLKVASVLAEGLGGPATMDVSIAPGGGAWTAQRYSAAVPLPMFASTARTAKTCDCSARSRYVIGEVQASGPAPSSEHSNVASGWSDAKPKVASELSDGSGGASRSSPSGVRQRSSCEPRCR